MAQHNRGIINEGLRRQSVSPVGLSVAWRPLVTPPSVGHQIVDSRERILQRGM